VIDNQADTQGWNRYSYVKGNPIRYKDPTGHNIVILEAEEGGPFGVGHTAILVQTKEGDWAYFSRQGTNKDSASASQKKMDIPNPDINNPPRYKNPREFFLEQSEAEQKRGYLQKENKEGNLDSSGQKQLLEAKELSYFNEEEGSTPRYTKGLELKTTTKQDESIFKYIQKNQDKYNLATDNCKDLVRDSLSSADIKTENKTLPNSWFESLKENSTIKIVNTYEASSFEETN
jgi:hypothetical protein